MVPQDFLQGPSNSRSFSQDPAGLTWQLRHLKRVVGTLPEGKLSPYLLLAWALHRLLGKEVRDPQCEVS